MMKSSRIVPGVVSALHTSGGINNASRIKETIEQVASCRLSNRNESINSPLLL
jgi:hypothetical protein